MALDDRAPGVANQTGEVEPPGDPSAAGGDEPAVADPVTREIGQRRPVTKWERWVEERDGVPAHWEHNHLADGHEEAERPTPRTDAAGVAFKTQAEMWSKGEWRSTHGHLVGNRNEFMPAGPPHASDASDPSAAQPVGADGSALTALIGADIRGVGRLALVTPSMQLDMNNTLVLVADGARYCFEYRQDGLTLLRLDEAAPLRWRGGPLEPDERIELAVKDAYWKATLHAPFRVSGWELIYARGEVEEMLGIRLRGRDGELAVALNSEGDFELDPVSRFGLERHLHRVNESGWLEHAQVLHQHAWGARMDDLSVWDDGGAVEGLRRLARSGSAPHELAAWVAQERGSDFALVRDFHLAFRQAFDIELRTLRDAEHLVSFPGYQGHDDPATFDGLLQPPIGRWFHRVAVEP